MKSFSKTENGILVTGSSGFIGGHLCAQLQRVQGAAPAFREINVLDQAALKKLAGEWEISTVIHLAGFGRVVAPVSMAPAMFSTAIAGTLNVVEAFVPRLLLLASTCAVYGTTDDHGATAGVTLPKPAGLYGLSRTSCEKLATNWSLESGNTAVVLRFGNVIGEGCGGLIPYLVDHAVRYPDGRQPARLRGKGRIVRDYVPVAHCVNVMLAAAGLCWNKVEERLFNLGTGRGRANGDIAALVAQLLAQQGYKLHVEYDSEPGSGEARQAILNVDSTTATFGIEAPAEEVVRGAIADAVHFRLAQSNNRTKAVAR